MPALRIHTHCQVAQKPTAKPKLVKEYGCPSARTEKIAAKLKEK